MKTAIGSLTLALTLIVTPGAAQSIPAVKDADWCRAFDPKTEDRACVNPVSRKPPVPIRPGLYLTPPLEYDHPYSGELITTVVDSQDKVRELCPEAKFSPTIGALACTRLGVNSNHGKCWIVIADDELITSLGHIPDLVRGHEIAHCNGWPDDHRGALPFKGAVQNAASQFDNFAFNAVRKTVAEVANNLAQSNKAAAAQFIMAAKHMGLTPESQLTPQVLGDPATAAPLGRAAGIGTNLSDDQWQQAHAIALQISRARQAEKAAGGVHISEEWAADDTPVKAAASQFDKFAISVVGKTVAEVARVFEGLLIPFTPVNLGRQFSLAAAGVGLTPESPITKEILSNPATARPLAQVVGIGTDLSDEQWREAHAIAFYAAKARRAENAAAASQSVPNLGQAAPQPQQTQPAGARATTDVVCGVVLNTPDGFLAVRERPGTQTRMTAKLRPGQSVNISSENCVWQSNGNVTCNKWIMVSGSDGKPASGWVRSKYLQPSDC